MASYNVTLAASARKELRHLPQRELVRIHQRLTDLTTTPRPHGVQKLAGSEDAAREVIVLRIRHRKDAYR